MAATGSRRAKGAAGAILTAVTIAVAPATASAPAKPRCLDYAVVSALQATHDSVFAIRCADLTGEGVRDVAYMKIADGARPAGTIIEWGVVYSTGAGIQTARFSGHQRLPQPAHPRTARADRLAGRPPRRTDQPPGRRAASHRGGALEWHALRAPPGGLDRTLTPLSAAGERLPLTA